MRCFSPVLSAMGLTAFALALLAPAPVLAQDDALPPALIPFGEFQVRPLFAPERVEVNEVDGQQELVLSRTAAVLEGVEFSEGVIEFDLAFEDRFGFGGLMWHADGDGDYEYFYIRQHKSGMVDAGQYTPARDGLTSWQIYTDRNALAPLAHTHEGWNRLKFVIADDKADIYYNGSAAPILHVPDLATDRGSGLVGFRTSGPNGKIRFRNVTIRPLAAAEGIVGAPSPEGREAPEGVIKRWAVSTHFPEAQIAEQLTLPEALSSLKTKAVLDAESFGILDLSRSGLQEREGDTVLVTTRIFANEARRARLQFGYSDRVRLFLNGELVFDGVAGWRSRDRFFLGTIGFEDAVMLDLREGENVLSAAVSETFGGWGFAGAIADREGLAIAPTAMEMAERRD